MDEERDTDEILGITRCVQCGHRLEGEVECPFCSMFDEEPKLKGRLPDWIYITACFMTFPFSIYWIVRSTRLNMAQKIFTASGFVFWVIFLGL